VGQQAATVAVLLGLRRNDGGFSGVFYVALMKTAIVVITVSYVNYELRTKCGRA